jgi:hypothetical protein
MKSALFYEIVIIITLLFSCGRNTDFTEIDRSMDDLNRRIDRMKTVAEGLNGKDIENYKKSFLWNVDEFESSYKRLSQELDDIKKTGNEGVYSGIQINDFRYVIDRLVTDADKLVKSADDAVKFMNMSGLKDIESQASSFVNELQKFKSELSRINHLVTQLKSDAPLNKTEDVNDGINKVPADTNIVARDTNAAKATKQVLPDSAANK